MNWRWAIVPVATFALTLARAEARPPHKKTLAEHIGPSLAKRLNDCRTCHLPAKPGDDSDEKPHNSFGLRLKEMRDELKKSGAKSGIAERIDAIADEDSDGDGASNLLELLAGHFPGEADDKPTTDENAAALSELARFRRVDRGARWSPFERVKRPNVPDIAKSDAIRNPIDAFLAVDRDRRGLKPRPPADRVVLLRRVHLDLTGLPPTPDELHAFLADTSDSAFEKVVDRLLASPRYGERWGRHWMDIWRYSDWAGWGQQVRDSQPHIWRWRDWIIESLNADKPYDRMVVEMLAADEVAPDDPATLRATGFLARNYKLLSREKWMQDTVDHTSQAFLGVTLGCAKCHDHMYDPFTQKEYYQVRAIFEPHNVRLDKVPGQVDTTKDGLPRVFDADPAVKTFLFVRGDDRTPAKEPLTPGVPEALGVAFPAIEPVSLPRAATSPDRRPFVVRDMIAAIEAEVVQARAALATTKGDAPIELAKANIAVLEARVAAETAIAKAVAIADDGKRDSEAWKQAAIGATIAQRSLAVAEARLNAIKITQARHAAPAPEKAEADKKAAEALKAVALAEEAAKTEPTTAYAPPKATAYPTTSTGRRLAFARWITSPDNPLTARVAVNHLWARHFGRGIVPSVSDFGRNGQKPSHPLLLDWLASELIDQHWSMKAIHRLIVTSATYREASTPDEGNLAIDPDNVDLWRFPPRRAEAEVVRDALFAVAGELDLAMGGPEIDHANGLTVPRRSVYFRHAAEKQMEFLKIFDAAGVTECYQRKDSILPQQALALANSELTLKLSKKVAADLAKSAGTEPKGFTRAAFERVLSRPATEAELAECVAYLNRASSEADRSSAAWQATESAAGLRDSLVHVLMNHHDFVTIR